MSLSRIEGVAPAEAGLERARRLQQHQRPLWRRWLPRSLFGRSLLIIVTPLVLLQLIAIWIFYDRHWDTVARRLSQTLAGEISLAIDLMHEMPAGPTAFLATASEHYGVALAYAPGAILPNVAPPRGSTILEDQLASALRERVRRPFHLYPDDPQGVRIVIQLPDGTLTAVAPKKRLFTSTTYIFVMWMVGLSLVLFAVAILFMRNQVRAVRRLAHAAESFGKGREVPNFKLEGATEIRQAAAAFLVMKERLQRQISQRTEMLAGVSHDLRTPLTRMKLALAMAPTMPLTDELRSDIGEMERMVQGYLEFARGEGFEALVETDLKQLLEDVVGNARRAGADVTLIAENDFVVPLRAEAMKRCLANLIDNARRHGAHVWVTALPIRNGLHIIVDDDGPGIPGEQREAVFRPFLRLDPSRNPTTGGVGLGLTIARDIARSHGGDIALEEAPQGGLRARVFVPL